MNNLSAHPIRSRAFTLVELAISIGMLGIVAGVIYTVLNGGMILFSKNIATNHSNLTARAASIRLVQDLHESIGRPELVNLPGSSFQNATNTTAQGVRFPVLLNPTASYIVVNSSGSSIPTVSPSSSVSLKIPQQTNAPKVGDILIFPDIEDTLGNTLTRKITAISLGSPTTVTVKDLGISLTINPSTLPTPPIEPTLIYIARLAAYCVVPTTTATDSDGLPTKTEVRYYPDASDTSKYTVTTTNMTTYLPAGTSVLPDGPFSLVSGTGKVVVQLISINDDTSNRNFASDRMVLSETIPAKCEMLQSTNYN